MSNVQSYKSFVLPANEQVITEHVIFDVLGITPADYPTATSARALARLFGGAQADTPEAVTVLNAVIERCLTFDFKPIMAELRFRCDDSEWTRDESDLSLDMMSFGIGGRLIRWGYDVAERIVGGTHGSEPDTLLVREATRGIGYVDHVEHYDGLGRYLGVASAYLVLMTAKSAVEKEWEAAWPGWWTP